MIYLLLNFVILSLVAFLIKGKNKKQNLLFSFIISSFLVIELLSDAFFSAPINEDFLYFVLNIRAAKFMITTKFMHVYFCFLLFLLFWRIFYIIFLKEKWQFIKFKKHIAIAVLIWELAPCGYIYPILHIPYYYMTNLYKQKGISAEEIFKNARGIDYIGKEELTAKIKGKKKNLIFIYLESYEQQLLKNPKLTNYSKELQELAKNNIYYSNIPQLKKQMGTMKGMFVTQCGIEMHFFPVLNNILADGKTTNMVCLGDVLHKAGYKQYYYGGADSELFNKKNLFYSHGTDEVYGRNELKTDLKMSMWGVYDYDLFEILKKKYIEYEKNGEPFALTTLTTSTHNPDGIFDARCKNTTDNQMLNAIECTSFLVNDFVNFLKKQKHFDDTLIILLPDHIQYNVNGIMDILNEVEKDARSLFMIILNSKKSENKERFVYTQMPEFIIKELGIETNAVFMGEEKENIVLNFLHKIHK